MKELGKFIYGLCILIELFVLVSGVMLLDDYFKTGDIKYFLTMIGMILLYKIADGFDVTVKIHNKREE